jgi:hypothetical protein
MDPGGRRCHGNGDGRSPLRAGLSRGVWLVRRAFAEGVERVEALVHAGRVGRRAGCGVGQWNGVGRRSRAGGAGVAALVGGAAIFLWLPSLAIGVGANC